MIAYLIQEQTERDIIEVQKWLTKNIRAESGDEGLVFPKTLLSKTGLSIHSGDGRLLASISLYVDRTSPVGYAGWCVGNPENHYGETYRAISLLLDALPIYAGEQGCDHLFTQFGNRAINRMLDRKGYKYGEETKSYVISCYGKE